MDGRQEHPLLMDKAMEDLLQHHRTDNKIFYSQSKLIYRVTSLLFAIMSHMDDMGAILELVRLVAEFAVSTKKIFPTSMAKFPPVTVPPAVFSPRKWIVRVLSFT